jgi:ElaB/YqjD/DUF883 family membrane-anchored ribosome-binding protein
MIIDAASEDEGQASGPRGDIDDLQRPSAAKKGHQVLESAQTKLDEAKHAATKVAGAAKEKALALGEAASEAAGTLRRRAQDVYSQGRSTAVRVGHEMQQGYRSGAGQLEVAMREYPPFAVAIGFAAAGALFGVLLPRTRPEDEFVGEKSAELLDVTKEKGQEFLDRGKAVAERIAETAMGEARHQGLTPEAATEKISEIAGKVGEIAHKITEEAGKAAEKENLVPEVLKKAQSPPDKGSQSRPPGQS